MLLVHLNIKRLERQVLNADVAALGADRVQGWQLYLRLRRGLLLQRVLSLPLRHANNYRPFRPSLTGNSRLILR